MQCQSTLTRTTITNAVTKPLTIILLLCLVGCAGIPGVSLPAGSSTRDLGQFTPGSPLAWSPDSTSLALARNGLSVINLENRATSVLDEASPVALAWNADGVRLAAAFFDGEESLLRLYGQGDIRREVRLAGEVEALFWSGSGEIVAIAHRLSRYSFGANFASFLYRWDGSDKLPGRDELHNTTLKHGTLKAMENQGWSFNKAALSADGKLLLYGELHDPPVFPTYSRLVVRILDSGEEHPVKDVSPAANGLFLSPGNKLLIGDGEANTTLIDAFTATERGLWPWPGRTLATSPGAVFMLIDGHLLREGKEVGTLPPETEGWFAPNGEALAIRREGRLFVLTGL